MNALVTYLLSAMVSWTPVAEHAYYEPRDQTLVRYEIIAHAIASVVNDPSEPSLFGGPDGRAETGLFVASIAYHESGGFRRDVQTGVGKHARGDSGRSWCLMQVNIGGGRTTEGWSGEELVADLDKCVRAGLHRVRESFLRCSGQTFADRLSGYTDGRCHDDARAAHRRAEKAVQYWEHHVFREQGTPLLASTP